MTLFTGGTIVTLLGVSICNDFSISNVVSDCGILYLYTVIFLNVRLADTALTNLQMVNYRVRANRV